MGDSNSFLKGFGLASGAILATASFMGLSLIGQKLVQKAKGKNGKGFMDRVKQTIDDTIGEVKKDLRCI